MVWSDSKYISVWEGKDEGAGKMQKEKSEIVLREDSGVK